MKIRFSILALAMAAASVFTTSVFAGGKETVVITPVAQDADAANGGIVYSLPQTMVRIRLTARVVVESAGPYFKYSTRYLNLSNVVTNNSTTWSLVSAQVTTYGVADASRRFKLSATPAAAMPAVALAPDGALQGFNVAAAPMCDAVASTAPTTAPAAVPGYCNFESVRLPQSVVTRTSTTSMAEECANAIFNIRATRLDLLAGAKEAQLPDAGAYKRVLDDLDRQEDDLVSLFAGRRDTFTVVRYVDILPELDGNTNVVPIRFSPTAGFVDAMDLSGKPVYVDFEFKTAQRVNAYPEGSKQRQKEPVAGFRYLLPGQLGVRVSDRNIPLAQTTVLCSQNAQELTLPAEVVMASKVVIDPATGALVSVSAK